MTELKWKLINHLDDKLIKYGLVKVKDKWILTNNFVNWIVIVKFNEAKAAFLVVFFVSDDNY